MATYTLPANTYIKINGDTITPINTGITLASYQKITYIKINAKSSVRFKNITNTSFEFNPFFDFYKSNIINMENMIAQFRQPTSTTIGPNETVALNIAEENWCTYENEKGYTLYLRPVATAGILYTGNALQLLDSLTFTITIENDKVTLTTAVYPSNAGSVTSGGLVEIGADTQLTATPASGYVFDRWVFTKGVFSNPNSSTATYTMPDEDVTVYATFKQSGSALTAGRYNGSAYDAVIPMYYDGTNWIECDLKYYNGANWVDSDTL